MDRIGALPKDIKQKNDAEILRSIAGQRVFTVQDIANQTKISRLTITRALERFIEKGIVIQGGKGSSTSLGGKKPQEYSLNDGRYGISIAPSGGETLACLMSFTGEEIDTVSFMFPAALTYEAFIEKSAESVRILMKRNGIPQEDLYGIILCTGGIIDRKSGIFRTSSIPQWGNDLHAAEDLSRMLGLDTRIEIENVSKVCSSMLRFSSEVQGKRTAVMYADFGVSITILEDGKTLESTNDVNGELGHMCLDPHDEEACVCGSKGCFEVLISQKRIWKMVNAMPEKEREVLLKNYDGKGDIRRYLLEEEKREDGKAGELCTYMADIIGMAFRNVVLAIDPDLFVIQGVFSYASDRFLERIKSVVRENKYLKDIPIDIREESRELSDMLKKGSMNIMLSSILEK